MQFIPLRFNEYKYRNFGLFVQYAEKAQKFYKGKDAVAHIEALLPAVKGTVEKPMEENIDKITISDFCNGTIFFIISTQ